MTTYFGQRQLDAIASFNLSSLVVEGLKRYVDHGVPPGDFLYAMLTNNLTETFARADIQNQTRVMDYVTVLYNYIPAEAWGSEDKVEQWMTKRKEENHGRHETI